MQLSTLHCLFNPGAAVTTGTAVTPAAVTPAAVTPASIADADVMFTGVRRIKLGTAKPPVLDCVNLYTEIKYWLKQVREHHLCGQVDQVA